MDALEFARELKRMCESYTDCGKCRLYSRTTDNCNECNPTLLENAIPEVEQWSAEHPLVRNVDYVAEGLEKLGYKVDKSYLAKYTCPAPYSPLARETMGCPEDDNCEECRKWWLEEHKGKNTN